MGDDEEKGDGSPLPVDLTIIRDDGRLKVKGVTGYDNLRQHAAKYMGAEAAQLGLYYFDPEDVAYDIVGDDQLKDAAGGDCRRVDKGGRLEVYVRDNSAGSELLRLCASRETRLPGAPTAAAPQCWHATSVAL